jgi:hypothetical protein
MQMIGSETRSAVAGALAKARAAFPRIIKGNKASVVTSKGSYSYTYADLADIMEAVTPHLSANGLCVTNDCELDANTGLLIIRAFLVHESGEWLGSTAFLPAPPVDGKPQDFGGRMTFGRRYALSNLLNLATEDDDDANATQGHAANIERKPPQAKKPSPDNLEAQAFRIVREYGPEGAAENWDRLSRERKKAAYDAACESARAADPSFKAPF